MLNGVHVELSWYQAHTSWEHGDNAPKMKNFHGFATIPNFKEILSLHILQEMRHSVGVTPIGGLVYMCQHVLLVILRYFSSSIKNKVTIAKKQGYRTSCDLVTLFSRNLGL